jgi:hypothetical protein
VGYKMDAFAALQMQAIENSQKFLDGIEVEGLIKLVAPRQSSLDLDGSGNELVTSDGRRVVVEGSPRAPKHFLVGLQFMPDEFADPERKVMAREIARQTAIYHKFPESRDTNAFYLFGLDYQQDPFSREDRYVQVWISYHNVRVEGGEDACRS